MVPHTKAAKAPKLIESVYDALDAILEMGSAKVEEETKPLVTQAQLREELFRMHGSEGFDRLELHHQQIIDDQVRAKSFLEDQLAVTDRDRHLPSHWDSSLP